MVRIRLHSKLIISSICCPALCGSEVIPCCAGKANVGSFLQLGPAFLKMYVLMTVSGASDKSIQQMPDCVMGCYVTSPLFLCCRPTREYTDGSLCVACHAECRPLNGSASCHGPVRCVSDCTVLNGIIWWVSYQNKI